MTELASQRQAPDPEVVVTRAMALANNLLWSLGVQGSRLTEDDSERIYNWWADMQFFIVAAWRLRRCAETLNENQLVDGGLSDAIAEFDSQTVGLKSMRDIPEHLDDYLPETPNRHKKQISSSDFSIGSWDGRVYKWLGHSLHLVKTHDAASALYREMTDVARAAVGAEAIFMLSAETITGNAEPFTRTVSFGVGDQLPQAPD